MSLLIKGGITKLSELEIDVDKDWDAKGISNLKEIVASMVRGDIPFRGASVLEKVPPGVPGHFLEQGELDPFWGPVTTSEPGPGGPGSHTISMRRRFFTLIADDAVLPAAGAPARTQTDGTHFSYQTLDFDHLSEEVAYWADFLPLDYQGENVEVYIFWKSTANTGRVVWGVSTGSRGDDDTWDAALGTERLAVGDAPAVAGNLEVTKVGPFAPGWTEGESLVFKIARKAAEAQDDMAADASVVMIGVSYTSHFQQSFYPVDMPVDITPSETGWQTVELEDYIPLGATGIIFHIQNSSISSPVIRLRKPGSTDEYFISDAGSSYPGVAGHSHLWGMCGVSGDRKVEIYCESLPANLTIWLIGYTDEGVTWFTNGIDVTPAMVTAWQTVDLSPYVPSNAIGVIFVCFNMGYWNGIRKYGSSDDIKRYAPLKWAITGCSTDQKVDMFIRDTMVGTTRQQVILIGYVTDGCTFYTNAMDKSLTNGGWADIDCSGEAPSARFLFFLVEKGADGTPKSYGLRKDGSTENIYEGAYQMAYAFVECSDSQIVEGKREDNTVKFRLVGYATAEL